MSNITILDLLKMQPLEIVDICIKELKERENAVQAKPLDTSLLDAMRLNGKELPPSLKRFLSFDSSFNTLYIEGWGDFDNTAPMGDKPGEWQPVPPENEIKIWIEMLAGKPLEELKLLDQGNPIATPLEYLKYKLTGKLFQLPNAGEQTNFLYVGNPDQAGEYPVVGFEMEGGIESSKDNSFDAYLGVWVKYPNFPVYLYHSVFDIDFNDGDFQAQTEVICRNNPELLGA